MEVWGALCLLLLLGVQGLCADGTVGASRDRDLWDEWEERAKNSWIHSLSLCSRFALREQLCLPVHGLTCILALRRAVTRGYLWLMGSAAILCFLIQTFQIPTGDRVTSSCLRFGNAYFMNVKKIGRTYMLHPWSCLLHVSVYICIYRYCQYCHGMIKHIELNTFDQQTFGRPIVFAGTEPCLSRNIGKRGCQGTGTECCL